VTSFSPSALEGVLAPSKLRKDGIRLGVVGVASIVYALLFEQALVDVLLLAVNGFGVLVATIAIVVALSAARRHGRRALGAAAVYGGCLALHVLAIVLIVA
jgi:hypothetical protein